MKRILTVNPGSTSTKVVIFECETPIFTKEVAHPKKELTAFANVFEQMEYRLQTVRDAVGEADDAGQNLDAVVGRGGLLAPLQGGTYTISDAMLADLKAATYGEHPCNLGAPMAKGIGEKLDIPAYISDPPVTDEMDDVARFTGLPEVRRRSIFHALSQRGAARTAAQREQIQYESGKFIVAHMGGGTSIGAHLHGKVIDVINALDGEGPMTPERTGMIPALNVLELLESGAYDIQELKQVITREGGVFAHLGTNDFRKVEQRMDAGDEQASAVFNALAYTLSRSICSLLPPLVSADDPKPLTAIVLTGGMARSARLVKELTRRLVWLAPIHTVTGVEEMLVMAQNAIRVLEGRDAPKTY